MTSERLRVVGVESGLKLVMCGHEIAVGLVLESEAGFEIRVLEFVAFHGITLDGLAVSLGHREFLASLGPVYALVSGLPVNFRWSLKVVKKGTLFTKNITKKCNIFVHH